MKSGDIVVMKDGTAVRLLKLLPSNKAEIEFIGGTESGLIINYSLDWLEPLTRDKYNSIKADLAEKLQTLDWGMELIRSRPQT